MANARTFDDAMHTSLPGSPVPDLSSNFGSPDNSAPDLQRMGGRSSTLDDKVNENPLTTRAAAISRTKRVRIRKLRPDAFPVNGHYYDQSYKY